MPIKAPKIVGLGGTLRPSSTSSVALQVALDTAEHLGADTELLDLFDLDLPLFRPGLPIEAFGQSAVHLVRTCAAADAILWSTSAYHGSLSGSMKNALDFLEFMAGEDRTYFDGRPIGLIATAAGEQAAVNAVNSMVSIAHALHATVASLLVPIPRVQHKIDKSGRIIDRNTIVRLEKVGRLVTEMAVGRTAILRMDAVSAIGTSVG